MWNTNKRITETSVVIRTFFKTSSIIFYIWKALISNNANGIKKMLLKYFSNFRRDWETFFCTHAFLQGHLVPLLTKFCGNSALNFHAVVE